MPINNNILNQKGTPAFYSDIFANRPAFGYAGRVFISTDTGAIYEDTGSAWTLIADAGAGTTGTLQQVTTNGNTTTLGVTIQGIDINDGAGTGVSNTAIGLAALQLNTTGAYNTAIGYGTLQANTTGSNNLATGYHSLFANTTGLNNVAIGYGTLQANTTGSANTGVGYLSLSANTTAGSNTAIGHEALRNNTTGAQNTAVGHQSLRINTTGQYNVSVGQDSLANNIIGSNNTAIGQGSLRNNTADGNVAVGYLSSNVNTTGVNNSSLGLSSLRLNSTGSNNTAIGSIALQNNTTGSNNTAVGYASLTANTTGSNNTAIGIESLIANTTGGSNIAIGNQSLSANTTGNFNSGIGINSLITNTTGQYNTALGTYSLYSNTTANNNTGIGANSLYANTTGAGNTAIGYSSLQSNTTANNNVAIGFASLTTNTTGVGNTAIGTSALNVNSTASYNTAIGFGSLILNTTGTQNTAIGVTAGNLITTGSNNTIIGNYGGTPTLANNIVLSDGAGNVRLFSDANGLIGINQAVGSTIGGQLDIHTTQTYALVLNGLTTSNAYTAFSNNSVGKWRIGNTYNAGANSFDIFNLGTSSNALSIKNTNNYIGLNTIKPTAQLTILRSSTLTTLGQSRYLDINDDYANTGARMEIGLGYTASGNATNIPAVIGYLQTSSGSYTYGDIYFATRNVTTDTAPTIRANITASGNFLIGTTTDEGYKFLVNGQTKVNSIITNSGDIGNTSTGTFYTGFTINSAGMYLVWSRLPAGTGDINYTANCVIISDGSVARIANLTALSCSIQLSGLNVQFNQSSGGNQGSLIWYYQKIGL